MIEIILNTYPKQLYEVELAGRVYSLRVRYSNLLGQWRFDLLDRSTKPPTDVLTGIMIVTGVDLLKPYGLGIGQMRAIAVERPGVDPLRQDLGSRVRLVYAAPEAST